MIKQIDGKWYHSNTVWEPLEEPADFEKQKCALFRQGQADRKAGLGILQNWGSYIDGWHNPEKTVPPYITVDQKEAFDL